MDPLNNTQLYFLNQRKKKLIKNILKNKKNAYELAPIAEAPREWCATSDPLQQLSHLSPFLFLTFPLARPPLEMALQAYNLGSSWLNFLKKRPKVHVSISFLFFWNGLCLV